MFNSRLADEYEPRPFSPAFRHNTPSTAFDLPSVLPKKDNRRKATSTVGASTARIVSPEDSHLLNLEEYSFPPIHAAPVSKAENLDLAFKQEATNADIQQNVADV